MLLPLDHAKVYPAVVPPTFADALPGAVAKQVASVFVTVATGFTVPSGMVKDDCLTTGDFVFYKYCIW